MIDEERRLRVIKIKDDNRNVGGAQVHTHVLKTHITVHDAS